MSTTPSRNLIYACTIYVAQIMRIQTTSLGFDRIQKMDESRSKMHRRVAALLIAEGFIETDLGQNVTDMAFNIVQEVTSENENDSFG